MSWLKDFIDGYRSVKPTHDDWGFRLMILFFLVGMACLGAVLYFG